VLARDDIPCVSFFSLNLAATQLDFSDAVMEKRDRIGRWKAKSPPSSILGGLCI
jgi:hypothetical protein